MKQKKRLSKRKHVAEVAISNLTSLEHFKPIARWGQLVDVSSSGLLLHIDRQDLEQKDLRQNLNLEDIEGLHVTLMIDPMELEITGYISRTKYLGKGLFEIAVDFTLDAPEYWRECLYELLPGEGEMYSEDDEL